MNTESTHHDIDNPSGLTQPINPRPMRTGFAAR
jgi:hypothetical protein